MKVKIHVIIILIILLIIMMITTTPDENIQTYGKNLFEAHLGHRPDRLMREKKKHR